MSKEVRNISNFFQNELCDYSCYSTLRMIASAIDGLKNSSRKIINTALDKNLKETKVTVFDNLVQAHTQYLHGSCANVIQNMGADYVGSNALPLIKGVGNFGSRFVNDASAPRYIYAKNQPFIYDIFDIRDVLIEQHFEGDKIEPQFYVPVVPLLLINGSMNGLASGFKQHILPRNPIEIIKYLAGKKADLNPFIKGFKGRIMRGEEPHQWVFMGNISIAKNTVFISEIPPFIEYQKYNAVLDKLEETKKIKSYKDLSDAKKDEFKYEVKLDSADINKGEEHILNLLGLIRKESEIYNALNEHNQVQTFNNIEEILDYFKTVRLEYQLKQKEFNITQLEFKLSIAESKYIFINNIINNKLTINKRKKQDIILDLDKLKLNDYENYEYLFRLPVHSFTEETLIKLKEDAENFKNELSSLKEKSEIQLWSEKLGTILKLFKS